MAKKSKKKSSRKAAPKKSVKEKSAKKTAASAAKGKNAKGKKKPAAAKKKAVKKKAAPARKTAAKKTPAKAKQIVGEGDYAASRAFDKDQAGFVKKNKAKIPALGQAAEKALEGPEGDSLRAAEADAAARSRDTF